jgi:hypothetical protein
MNRPDALEIARTLLRPTVALGYLVTRGSVWSTLPNCNECKRAIGGVMGSAYLLLQPIWDEHPSLDPGSGFNSDPLDLGAGPKPPETTPGGLLPYLDEIQRTLNRLLSRMLGDPSIGRHKEFIETSAQELREAITEARRILEDNATRSS